ADDSGAVGLGHRIAHSPIAAARRVFIPATIEFDRFVFIRGVLRSEPHSTAPRSSIATDRPAVVSAVRTNRLAMPGSYRQSVARPGQLRPQAARMRAAPNNR